MGLCEWARDEMAVGFKPLTRALCACCVCARVLTHIGYGFRSPTMATLATLSIIATYPLHTIDKTNCIRGTGAVRWNTPNLQARRHRAWAGNGSLRALHWCERLNPGWLPLFAEIQLARTVRCLARALVA